MTRRSPLFRITALLLLALSVGCQPQQPFYLFEDGDLSHYKGMATEIEVPDAGVKPLEEVIGSSAPLTLGTSDNIEYWDISLEEAIKIAMNNSKIIRSLGGSATSLDSLTRSPDMAASVYDPAITETDPRYGTEAALSAFDTLFSTSAFWEKTDRPLNVSSIYSSTFINNYSIQDVGTFQASLQKYNATGGLSTLSATSIYTDSNGLTRQWPSDWTMDLTGGFRQPLLQGSGVQFNRIAGPGAVPGFNNGVIIARLRTDVQLTEFELAVQNLVRDVESAYWQLYLSYRELDTLVAGRDSTLETWRKVHTLYINGAPGGSADRMFQAQGQYVSFEREVQSQLSNLYQIENQLRYIIGLAVADGRLARPSDEPTTAHLDFDWASSLDETLARNIDLRRQRWVIKQRELELIAAKNYVLPRLDAVGQYTWYGMGNELWRSERYPSTNGLAQNAMESWTSGRNQEWQFGLEMSLPIGFRKELSGVRNAQLSLARAKMMLKEEELDVSHQLGAAVRSVADQHVLINTSYQASLAHKQEVQAVQAAYDTGIETIDVLLGAQRRLAEAEIAYYRALVSYNLALVDVHLRKGSLLEYNGVYLAEGPWPGKAYFDARRRARSRDAAMYLDYGFTRPNVISRGPYAQHAGRAGLTDGEMTDGETIWEGPVDESFDQDDDAPMEMVPTPAPEPQASLMRQLTPIWETVRKGQADQVEQTDRIVRTDKVDRTLVAIKSTVNRVRPIETAKASVVKASGWQNANSSESKVQAVSHETPIAASKITGPEKVNRSTLRVLTPPKKSTGDLAEKLSDISSGGWTARK
jgi:outer membrane protein TolC